MNALAERILYSKSGFTRVVDRMEEAGLVRRVRPQHDRRSILIVLTKKGSDTMENARRYHRDGIERHFSQHLSERDIKALTHALEKVSTHARPHPRLAQPDLSDSTRPAGSDGKYSRDAGEAHVRKSAYSRSPNTTPQGITVDLVHQRYPLSGLMRRTAEASAPSSSDGWQLPSRRSA